MRSSIMREDFAIRLDCISKTYRLYGSQRDQLLDVLGLRRFGLALGQPIREFRALDEISLDIPRGHRVGIIGRNGAGKTTLLKLICGNFAPTSGTVEVNGTVQALLSIGLGFHPDYTGRENVTASLQYNGLADKEHAEAVANVIDFCELGEFIDQPFKIYSLGMQARLMFAAATAITPDILIVDEVLGAGDAYFVAKSKTRVDSLVRSGCTMLLVSHSTQQVLELCDEVVWINEGRIQMRGDALRVVKAYEEFLYGSIQRIANFRAEDAIDKEAVAVDHISESCADNRDTIEIEFEGDYQARSISRTISLAQANHLQEPAFRPHAHLPTLPEPAPSAMTSLQHQAPGGISRWDSDKGLKLTGFSIVTERGEGNSLLTMAPAKFVLFITAEIADHFDCRYGIAIHDMKGKCITRIFSPRDKFLIAQNQIRKIDILLNPNQIGPGDYTVGVSILKYDELENLNATARYDLLSRSFSVKVDLPDSLGALEASFFHTAEWGFETLLNE